MGILFSTLDRIAYESVRDTNPKLLQAIHESVSTGGSAAVPSRELLAGYGYVPENLVFVVDGAARYARTLGEAHNA